MAEPLVFHFKPGPNGHPHAMYMADARAACPVCQHPQIQRFYHATPFHSLTLERLVAIGTTLHTKAGYDCENCGTAVGPDAVEATALTFGFADDAGLVRIFVDAPNDAARATFELVPGRRLDPQELPTWEPGGGRREALGELDDARIERVLGRAVNPKLVWIDLLASVAADPAGGGWARAGAGLWCLADVDPGEIDALAAAIDDPDDAEDAIVIDLLDSAPEGLVTHRTPRSMPGNLDAWLPAETAELLRTGKLYAAARVSPSAVVGPMRRVFELARLTFEETDADGLPTFRAITTPTGHVYEGEPTALSMLRRAVYTGVTPGDAARLTAEEIAGVLLQVWKP